MLKAGHHGSSSSTSGPLLNAVRPKAVVVSSAYDSQYSHPHDEVLQRLAARSIPTYWTGTHGDIVLVSDGSCVSVRTQQAAPTDPSSLRDGGAVVPGTVGSVTERAPLGGSPVTGGTSTPNGETATPTPTQTDGGAQLAVTEIHLDAAGNDHENLTDEYVILENTGDEAFDLTGWTLSDDAGHTYTGPNGFSLPTGGQVTIHTGNGTNTATGERRCWPRPGSNRRRTLAVRLVPRPPSSWATYHLVERQATSAR